MTESGKKNTRVRVTNVIELEDIKNKIDKIDYKVTKGKFFNSPV